MSSEYDIPVLDGEEMWSQQAIDDAAKETILDIDKE
jgi:hypothetical protein